MKNVIALIVIVALSSVVLMSFQKKEKAKPGVQRAVCFKFKATASAEQRAKHMADFAAFAKEVPEALSYRAGKTVKGEQKSEPEYDVFHYVTFENEKAILAYDVHPAHKKFIEQNRDSWEKVIVINGEIVK